MLIALDIETSVQTGEPVCLTWSEAVLGEDGSPPFAGAPCGLHARDHRARSTFDAWLADDAVGIRPRRQRSPATARLC